MTAKCTSISTKSDLIEDYVLTETPPLAEDLRNRFVAVQPDPKTNRSDLLSVTPDNQLALFRADKSSPSAWVDKVRPVPGAPQEAIQKILAFYKHDTLHALVHYPDPASPQRTVIRALTWSDAEDGWQPMNLDAETKNDLERTTQMSVYEDAQGNLFLYALSYNYAPPALVVSKYFQKDGWVNVYRADADDPEATLRFLAGKDAEHFEAVQATGGQLRFREARIVGKKFAWTEDEPTTISLDVEAADIFSFASHHLENAFLLLSNDGRLFLVNNYRSPEPGTEELTGGANAPSGLRSVRTGVDAGGRTMVFAIDAAYRLWLLRQNVGQEGFGPWVELGEAASEIACPVAMADGAETFVAGVARDVTRVGESRADGLWAKRTLDRPKLTSQNPPVAPRYRSSYSWEVSASDAGGKAVPGAVVEIASDVSTTLNGNGLAYVVDANHPAAFVADETGKLYLEAEATELRSPELTVRVPGGTAKFAPIRADDRTHLRLAGLDKDFDTSTGAMRAAGVLPDKTKLDDQDADALVSAVRSTGQFMQAKHAQGEARKLDASLIENPCWRLTATKDGGFRFEALTEQELDAAVATLRQSGAVLSEGAGFHMSWGDFVSWFVNLGKKFLSIVVKTIGDGLQIVVQIAEKALPAFIVRTIAQASKAIEVIFAHLTAAFKAVGSYLEKAIEWLRMLFDWTDIVKTADAIAKRIATAISDTAAGLEARGEILNEKLAKAADELESYFDQLEKSFTESKTFNGLVGSDSTPSKSPLQDDTYPKTHSGHAIQCNYVTNKLPKTDDARARMQWGSISSDRGEVGDALDDALKTLIVELQLAKLKKSFVKLGKLFQQIHDPGSFFAYSIVALIEVTKDILLLILNAIRLVLKALVAGLVEGLRLVLAGLQKEIYIPFISELVYQFTKQPLSMISFVAFSMAVPMTIMSKLLFGHAPDFGGLGAISEPAARGNAILPLIYFDRMNCYMGKYSAIEAQPEGEPNFFIKYFSYRELGGVLLSAGIPHVAGRPVPKGPVDIHAWSITLLILNAGLQIEYFIRDDIGGQPKDVVSDTIMTVVGGVLEVLGAIVYTIEDYEAGVVTPSEQATMAVNYLSSFPDLCILGAILKEPDTAAVLGLLGFATYLGATIASGFVDLTGASG